MPYYWIAIFFVMGLLAGYFGYTLYSKIRSRHTIGLHRHPDNLRRSHREPSDFKTNEYRMLNY